MSGLACRSGQKRELDGIDEDCRKGTPAGHHHICARLPNLSFSQADTRYFRQTAQQRKPRQLSPVVTAELLGGGPGEPFPGTAVAGSGSRTLVPAFERIVGYDDTYAADGLGAESNGGPPRAVIRTIWKLQDHRCSRQARLLYINEQHRISQK